MEEGRASWSAEGAAALRADHALHDSPVVFDDRAALRLLSEELREQVESGGLRRNLEALELRPTQGHLVARARVAQDALQDAAGRGVGQLVVLGAGFDTSALRRDPRVRVFEVDHPATQALKRERLARLADAPLPGVEFAAVDFTREAPAEGLRRTSHDPGAASVVSWLGVVTYLRPADVRAALQGIRAFAGPGSELVCDYPVPPERLAPAARAIAERKNAELESRGEPRLSSWDPGALAALLEELGFEVVTNQESDALDARFFPARSDGLRANPENAVLHARLPA